MATCWGGWQPHESPTAHWEVNPVGLEVKGWDGKGELVKRGGDLLEPESKGGWGDPLRNGTKGICHCQEKDRWRHQSARKALCYGWPRGRTKTLQALKVLFCMFSQKRRSSLSFGLSVHPSICLKMLRNTVCRRELEWSGVGHS